MFGSTFQFLTSPKGILGMLFARNPSTIVIPAKVTFKYLSNVLLIMDFLFIGSVFHWSVFIFSAYSVHWFSRYYLLVSHPWK